LFFFFMVCVGRSDVWVAGGGGGGGVGCHACETDSSSYFICKEA